jgi:hypothetical protein
MRSTAEVEVKCALGTRLVNGEMLMEEYGFIC